MYAPLRKTPSESIVDSEGLKSCGPRTASNYISWMVIFWFAGMLVKVVVFPLGQ